MCRHKRLFLLQDWRKEDSGAPERQRGAPRGFAGLRGDARRPQRAGSRLQAARTSGEFGGSVAPGSRNPESDKNLWVSFWLVFFYFFLSFFFFYAGGGKSGGGCAEKASGLEDANQEERRTSPKLAVSLENKPVCVCVCVGVSTLLWNDTEARRRLTGCCRAVFSGLCKHFCAVWTLQFIGFSFFSISIFVLISISAR